MQDLGTLGGFDAVPYLLNEHGQIAGASYTNSTPNLSTGGPTLDPFLWRNGEMVDLGTLGGTYGFPLDLNNRGQVVGTSNLSGDLTAHAFLRDQGVLTDLGTVAGSYGEANAINDHGVVVGYAANAGDQAVAFLWRKGVISSLGTLGSDCASTANSINSSMRVVGISTATCDFSSGRRAFLWENGVMVDLNTLIPLGSGMQLTLAEIINDREEIAINGTPSGCGIVEQCGHAVLLITCNENHPGIDGCDYSMVEGSATTTPAPKIANPATGHNPVFGSAANPMLRGFGRGPGPWHRSIAGQPPNSTVTSPRLASRRRRENPPRLSRMTIYSIQNGGGIVYVGLDRNVKHDAGRYYREFTKRRIRNIGHADERIWELKATRVQAEAYLRRGAILPLYSDTAQPPR